MFSFQIKTSRCTFWWENESFHYKNCQLQECRVTHLLSFSQIWFFKSVSATLHKTSSPLSAVAKSRKKFMHYFAFSHPSRSFFLGGEGGDKHDGYRRKRELLGDDAEALWRGRNWQHVWINIFWRHIFHIEPPHNIRLLNIILFQVFLGGVFIQIDALDLFHVHVPNKSTWLVFISVWFCAFCLFHRLWWI